MPAASETSEVAILSRVIRPDSGTWSREAAESILEFDFPPADVRRMNALAAKAREGTLSTAEKAKLQNYRDVGRLLELLQSKARLSLKRSNGLSCGAWTPAWKCRFGGAPTIVASIVVSPRNPPASLSKSIISSQKNIEVERPRTIWRFLVSIVIRLKARTWQA